MFHYYLDGKTTAIKANAPTMERATNVIDPRSTTLAIGLPSGFLLSREEGSGVYVNECVSVCVCGWMQQTSISSIFFSHVQSKRGCNVA